MNEETKSKDKRVIQLTPQQYKKLERAMQWPEDLPQWDKLNKPTNMAEILGKFTPL